MVTDTRARPRQKQAGLSPEQLSEVLGLLKGADSVELKLSVPDADRRSTVAALAMDPLDAQIRQVVFFDTPDLLLNQHGVVVRGRRVQGREGDCVIKLRPVVPDELPAPLRKDPAVRRRGRRDAWRVRLLGDAEGAPQGRRRSSRCSPAGARSASSSRRRSGRSSRLTHLKASRWTRCTRLGPINVLKLKFTPPDFGRRVVAELWLYPDGFRLLELSTKCPPPRCVRRRRRGQGLPRRPRRRPARRAADQDEDGVPVLRQGARHGGHRDRLRRWSCTATRSASTRTSAPGGRPRPALRRRDQSNRGRSGAARRVPPLRRGADPRLRDDPHRTGRARRADRPRRRSRRCLDHDLQVVGA